jgi:hypothetical protein
MLKLGIQSWVLLVTVLPLKKGNQRVHAVLAPGTPWALRPATAPRKSIKSHETVNLFSDILGDSEVSLTTIRNTLRHCTFFGLYGYFKHIVPSFLYQ